MRIKAAQSAIEADGPPIAQLPSRSNPAGRSMASRHQKELKCRRPAGQFAVLFAFALVGLLGATSLATDVAVVYFQHVALQNGVDSAALAGANYLPAQTTDAVSTAQAFAINNGVQAAEIQSITVGSSGNTIRVVAQRNVPSFFARVLGMTQFTVTATAVAAAQPAGADVTGIMPIGLDSRTSYAYGEEIKMHQGGKSYGPGNWGGLALGATGASIYEANIINGYQGSVNVGDWLSTEPGATVGPTSDGITARLNAGLSFDPSAMWNEHKLDDPRVVTIPLVDWADAQGRSNQVQVMGFAEVWLTSVNGTDISGIFIAQGVRGRPMSGSPNGGALYVSLIQ
jgi:Putative Flp pilus-assembly TadE/G-like